MNNVIKKERRDPHSRWWVHEAGKKKRLINFLVDSTLLSLCWLLAGPWLVQSIASGSSSTGVFYFKLIGICALFKVAFYVVPEFLWGRTLGKVLTGTKVISLKGKEMNLLQALIRSLGRLLPFYQFAFLVTEGLGPHDSLSTTCVVRSSFEGTYDTYD